MKAVHKAFGLHDAGGEAVDATAGGTLPKSTPLDVVRRLEGMEDLAIEDCHLDSSQALVTFTDLPDTPGVAADVFREVGKAGLLVDMIVQSNPRNGRAELSFTVPAESRDRAIEVAGAIGKARGRRSPTCRTWQSSRSRASASAATRAWPTGCSSRSPTPASTSTS